MLASLLAVLLVSAPAAAAPDTCSFRPKDDIKNGYALSASWYIAHREILIRKRKYVKYGLPRMVDSNELAGFTTYRRAKVFVERGDKKRDVVYVLLGAPYAGINVADGSDKLDGLKCEYQAYQRKLPVRPRR